MNEACWAAVLNSSFLPSRGLAASVPNKPSASIGLLVRVTPPHKWSHGPYMARIPLRATAWLGPGGTFAIVVDGDVPTVPRALVINQQLKKCRPRVFSDVAPIQRLRLCGAAGTRDCGGRRERSTWCRSARQLKGRNHPFRGTIKRALPNVLDWLICHPRADLTQFGSQPRPLSHSELLTAV